MSERILKALHSVAKDLTSGYADNFDRRMADVLMQIAWQLLTFEEEDAKADRAAYQDSYNSGQE